MASLESKEGSLPKDGDLLTIQVAHAGQTEDGTGTPIMSPKATSGTGAITLTVPAKAVAVTLQARVADAKIGWNSTLDAASTGRGYYLLLNGKSIKVPCAAGDEIYFKRNAGVNATIDFIFDLLGATLG